MRVIVELMFPVPPMNRIFIGATISREPPEEMRLRRIPKSSSAGASAMAAPMHVTSPISAARPNDRMPWFAENSSDAYPTTVVNEQSATAGPAAARMRAADPRPSLRWRAAMFTE